MLGRSAYDEHGPYDIDFSATPSRPAPIPYDDPYAVSEPTLSEASSSTMQQGGPQRQHSRPRGRGWGSPHDQHGARGRGGRSGARGRGGSHHVSDPPSQRFSDPYDPRNPAPGTEMSANTYQQPYQQGFGGMATGGWGYPQVPIGIPGMMQQPPVFGGQAGYQQPFVQPHINPRFAQAAFGFNPMTSPGGFGGQFGAAFDATGSGVAYGGQGGRQQERDQSQWGGQWASSRGQGSNGAPGQ